MKNRRIRGDWDYSLTLKIIIINVIFAVFWIFILFITDDGFVPIVMFLCLPIIGCISGVIYYSDMGFTINYRKNKVYYEGKGNPRYVKIPEIDHVELQEIEAERKKFYLGIFDWYLNLSPAYALGLIDFCVYRNGKIYNIVVYKKDGEIIKYPYTALYQVRTKKRLMKQEAKMLRILDELNEYIAETDKYWQKMRENFG